MSFQSDINKVFDHLVASWQAWSNKDVHNGFWHMGNTLDACIDFIVHSSNTWNNGLGDRKIRLQEMLAESYDVFVNARQEHQSEFWWDDYGWWGISFMKVYDNFDLIFSGRSSPVTRNNCLRVALDSWQVLHDVAWVKEVQTPYRGPVEGGCWNTDPENGGVQNTVTNGLFLVLSIRLYQALKDRQEMDAKPYLESAYKQYIWFKDWLDREEHLFHYFGKQNERALVYERPYDPEYPAYNSGENSSPVTERQMWTGDQGLMLGGLVGLFQISDDINKVKPLRERDPNFQENVSMLVQKIAKGATWLFDSDYVLHEATFNNTFIYSFAVDYATGKGIFMRYLAYTGQILPLDYYDQFISATASAILQHTRVNAQIMLRWNNNSDTPIGTNENEIIAAKVMDLNESIWQITLQTAGLDALNAAITLLGPADAI